jgi:hypothetical protein
MLKNLAVGQRQIPHYFARYLVLISKLFENDKSLYQVHTKLKRTFIVLSLTR